MENIQMILLYSHLSYFINVLSKLLLYYYVPNMLVYLKHLNIFIAPLQPITKMYFNCN